MLAIYALGCGGKVLPESKGFYLMMDGQVLVEYDKRRRGPISRAQYKANGYKPALDRLPAEGPAKVLKDRVNFEAVSMTTKTASHRLGLDLGRQTEGLLDNALQRAFTDPPAASPNAFGSSRTLNQVICSWSTPRDQ